MECLIRGVAMSGTEKIVFTSCLYSLQGTSKKDKNELLFSQFSINYNTLPQIFRRGSCLIGASSSTGRKVVVTHEDIRRESFWTDILADTRSKLVKSHNSATVSFTNSQEDKCLPGTWIVVRLDGRCFHKYVTYSFPMQLDPVL